MDQRSGFFEIEHDTVRLLPSPYAYTQCPYFCISMEYRERLRSSVSLGTQADELG